MWKFDRLAWSILELLKIADQLKRMDVGFLLKNRHGDQTASQVAEQFGVERTTMYSPLREHRARMGKG